MPRKDYAWYWSSWEVKKKPSLSEWADAERYLSLESNPTGGKWKTETIPYLREIMDTITDDRYDKVVWMAPSQVGKTETMLNVVGWIMDVDPGPILVIQENLDNARSWSKDRLDPMLRDTPCLRGKISAARGIFAQESVVSNEVLHKSFKSGHITCVGSNSGAGLSMRPIRYVLADEVDAWAPSAGKEGDQLDLAEKRQSWYFNRKMLIVSSPRTKATSRIEPLYESSDQRKLYIPCPHCTHYQTLDWEHFQWDKALEDGTHLPETAHFVCVSCHERIEERHRHTIMSQCQWRATYPGRSIAGFWLWAAYCPPISWASIAQQYLDTHKNPEKYKVFVNTVLAKTWEEPGDAPEWDTIKTRADTDYAQWTVPQGVGFLVAAGDVQDDRIEFSVWGFGREEESWLVGHDVVWGNTDLDDPYLAFEQKVFLAIPQPSRQRALVPLLAFLDSGAKTQQVYSFVRTRPQIYAIKGSSQQFAPVIGPPTWQDIDFRGHKIKDGVQLWPVGVHRTKKLLYGRLKLPQPGPRYLHFPYDLSDDYYKQLTAEKLIVHPSGKEEFRKERANECLDCAVYAYAAAVLAGLTDPRTNWDQLCPVVEETKSEQPALPPVPIVHQPPSARTRQMRSSGQGMMGELLRR